MNLPLLLTMTQAGALLGFSRWQIRAMCRIPGPRGLGFIPLGRIHKRIPRTEVDNWIKRNTVFNSEGHRQATDGRRTRR